MSFVDDLIGQVLAALDSAGFADDTTIIFTSDHGEMLGDFGLWTKQVMFEGSAGIPMILAGPGIAAGRTVGTPVSLVDVFPTVLDAAGAPPASRPLPGRSLLEIAAAPEAPERPVLCEYHDGGPAPSCCAGAAGSWCITRASRPSFSTCPATTDEQHDLAREPDAPEFMLAACDWNRRSGRRQRALSAPSSSTCRADPDEHRDLAREPAAADMRDSRKADLRRPSSS